MSSTSQIRAWTSPILDRIWRENAAVRDALLIQVQGLTEVQLNFRPAPGRWSIGEILDHLCLAERSIGRTVSRLFQQAAGRGMVSEIGAMDPPAAAIDLARYSRPASAPEGMRPSPERPLARLLAGLEESRERLLEVSARADGLVVGDVRLEHFQLGEINFYQWLTLEGAHESKHLDQVRQIKSDHGFTSAVPKP